MLSFSRRGMRARRAHVNNANNIQRRPFFRHFIPDILDVEDSDDESFQPGQDRIPQQQYGSMDRVFLSKFLCTIAYLPSVT